MIYDWFFVNLVTCLKYYVSVFFPHIRLVYSLLPSDSEESHGVQCTLETGGLIVPPLGWSSSTIYLKFFVDFPLFPPFKILFGNLFLSDWGHEYLFCTLICILILLYSVVQTALVLASRSSCTWFLCILDRAPECVCVRACTRTQSSHTCFLPSTRCSKLILYISCPSLGITYFSAEFCFTVFEEWL